MASAIQKAQEKVALVISSGPLVAGFDFTILLSLAMKFLMEKLGSCLDKSPATASSRSEDGFWYQYFVQVAAKEAVNEKYPKHERSKEARKALENSMSTLTVEDRRAVVVELQEAHDDAGMLI